MNSGDMPVSRISRGSLSKLTEIGFTISESLELDNVLQAIADGARLLTGAGYAVIAIGPESQEHGNLVTSGLTQGEIDMLLEISEQLNLCEHLSEIPGPLREKDIGAYLSGLGYQGERFPLDASAFLAVPIRNRDESAGNIYLVKGSQDGEFTEEDEKVLVLFAFHASLIIGNALMYREELRTRTELETLIASAPIGVIVFDAETADVSMFNDEARRILGAMSVPADSVKPFLDSLTLRISDGREIALEDYPLIDALCAGKTVRSEEIAIRVPNLRSVSALVNATAVHSDGGGVTSVVVTLQDLTTLKEIEGLQTDFLGMVSHELRTPLTSIKGSVAAALESSSAMHPSELRQVFRIISDQADHMRRLINDLLDITRLDSSAMPVTPQPTALAGIVDQARTWVLNASIPYMIEADIPPDLPMVHADSQRILQVLCNLLTNATRHSPAGSVIRIAASVEDAHVVLSVADEGTGIPGDRLPNLFSRLYGVAGSGQLRGNSGLGLAICKGIVEAHGGRIWAESDGPGMGGRLCFTIPIAVASEVHPVEQQPVAPQETRRRARILAIDDDPFTLMQVRETLSVAGFETAVTGDTGAVGNLLNTVKPDLVLLDLVLRNADGIDIMKRVSEIADVPVIFLSAYSNDRHIARALDLGAADYIAKPFSGIELTARVKSALRRRGSPNSAANPAPYRQGDLEIDYSAHLVTVSGELVALTATEFALLAELSLNSGRVLTHDRLLQRIWGIWDGGDPRLVRSMVKKVRRKLGDEPAAPRYIFTEIGVGYRMAEASGSEDQ